MIIGKNVSGHTRHTIPLPHQDISEILNINHPEFLKSIYGFNIYYRKPEDCPFGRGNWIIDVKLISGEIYCLKLPKEMEEKEFRRYCQPLIDICQNSGEGK